MESESSRDGSTETESGRGKEKSKLKDETFDLKAQPTSTPSTSASSKLAKRNLFPSTPASYSDDDSSQGLNRKKRRKFTIESRDKPPSQGIHLSERQQVLLLKTFAAENSPKPSSPALSAASSSQGTFSASSGTDRLHRRNIRGETLLHIAAHKGDIKQLVELIEQGLDVNALDNADWTPLHEACNKGHVEAAKILLEHGALVNAKGDDDFTPLHDAAGSGSLELVKLLLKHGANPNAPDKSGRLPVEIPGSPTIVNEMKNWSTFKLVDESSNLSSKVDAISFDESSNAVPEVEFVSDSPCLASSTNAISPLAQSLSSSTYDSVPQGSNAEDEPCETPKAEKPGDATVTPDLEESRITPKPSEAPPPPLQSVTGDDDIAHDLLSIDTSEENPPPPLLTPQLPDDSSSAAAKTPEGPSSVKQPNTSLPPPCLEPAVDDMPLKTPLETLASSPPLVVITDVDTVDNSRRMASDRPTSSADLLLQVCVASDDATAGSSEQKILQNKQTVAESEEQSAAEDEVKINRGAVEPTVASSRTRRKIISKEAPALLEDRPKNAYRKRLGSVGVVSPNKDSNSSSNAPEAGAKAQPLRKRIINRSDDDSTVPFKEKKKGLTKEKDKAGSETAEQAPPVVNDPYEFVEDTEDLFSGITTQQVPSPAPASSPRSAGHISPAKQSTAQSSPSVSSVKTSSSRRNGQRSRRPSSPSSLTPNEMKLPPLKIRLNRQANPVAEASRQSESESSMSSTSAVIKTEAVDEELTNIEQKIEGMGSVEAEAAAPSLETPSAVGSSSESCIRMTSVPPRKRKDQVGLLTVSTSAPATVPSVSPSSLTHEQVANFFLVDKPRLPNYIKQWKSARDWVTERRRQQLASVQLSTVPRGLGDFLMIRKGYLLATDGGQQAMPTGNANQETQPPQAPSSLVISSAGNSTSTCSTTTTNNFSSTLPPQQLPSPSLPPSLQALFKSQEEARHRLRMQHRIEQEKLVLCYEQEVLRACVHRDLTAAQAQPLSACAILSERHMACRAPPEALSLSRPSVAVVTAADSSTAATASSAQQRAMRLTVRHQRPRLDDLDEKFTRLVDVLLQRQRHEAAAMRAVQAAEWVWRSEIVGIMSGNDSSPPGAGNGGNTGSGSTSDTTTTIGNTTTTATTTSTSYLANSNTVPLVSVPNSLPIPRLV